MITFKTRNSAYEVNTGLRLIRRVSGVNPCLACLPGDGHWREYSAISLREGECGTIEFSGSDPRVAQDAPSMWTSTIQEILAQGEPIAIAEYSHQPHVDDEIDDEIAKQPACRSRFVNHVTVKPYNING